MLNTPSSSTWFELAFTSELAELAAPELARLVGASWRCNRISGITGEMRLSGRTVRQVIEGDAAAILATAARILADSRHTGIVVTAFGAISSRRFTDWRVHGLAAQAVQAHDPEFRITSLRHEVARGMRRQTA